MKNVEVTFKPMSFEEKRVSLEKLYDRHCSLCGDFRQVLLDPLIPIKANLKHLKNQDDMSLNPYVLALETLIEAAGNKISDAIDFAEGILGRISVVVASGRHPGEDEGEMLGIEIDATETADGAFPDLEKIFVYDVDTIEKHRAAKKAAA